MINIAEMITDPDFCQSFVLTRSSGTFVNGRFTPSLETIALTGILRPANTKDIQMLPVGDVIRGELVVYSLQPIYTTRADHGNGAGLSDEVTWQGENYKIIQVQNYSDFGYYKALATRKLGA